MAGRALHKPFLDGEQTLAMVPVWKTSRLLASHVWKGTNEASLMTIVYKFSEQ